MELTENKAFIRQSANVCGSFRRKLPTDLSLTTDRQEKVKGRKRIEEKQRELFKLIRSELLIWQLLHPFFTPPFYSLNLLLLFSSCTLVTFSFFRLKHFFILPFFVLNFEINVSFFRLTPTFSILKLFSTPSPVHILHIGSFNTF